jgi:galactokinase
MDLDYLDTTIEKFKSCFDVSPLLCAYAPGRVEILGNHTDYNEGVVLSAAINYGTFFAVAPAKDRACRVVAGDLMEEVSFSLPDAEPVIERPWVNYVMGVADQLYRRKPFSSSFVALFQGNVPLGAGLSSSAALEMTAGLALAELFDVPVTEIELAKIGQTAEHEYAGVKTGLLDQISSLYGRKGQLVLSDFRSLEVRNVPLVSHYCFLTCNTKVKHALVESAYNERRRSCERATAFFAEHLDHPVHALRDVSFEEWKGLSAHMDPITASRAVHVITENERVLKGSEELRRGNLKGFGRLMFSSHASSKESFENSVPELDFLVDVAESRGEVLGARLSGGGFGGSVVIMVGTNDVEKAGFAFVEAFEREFGYPCDVMTIEASEGAKIVEP